MKMSLKVLHLEDNPNDAELVRSTMDKEGVECDIVRVKTREDFINALEKDKFNLILADYTLPSFDGFSALKICKEINPDIPFIFVTGTLGEEIAIETLKAGATDYVLKDKLSRLVPAVNRALKEAEEKAERKLAKEALKESEELYQLLFNGITDAVYVHEVSVEKPGKIIAVNDCACRTLGYTAGELLQMEVGDIDIPEQSGNIPSIHEKLFGDGYTLFETCHVAKDGRRIPVEINIRLFELKGKQMVLSVARVITERKQAEERLRKVSEVQAALHDPGTLPEKLKKITDSVVDIFNADFARIWLIRPGDLCRSGCVHTEITEDQHVCRERGRCLHLAASSGRYTHLNGKAHRRVPFGCYKIGLIASGEYVSFLTNDVTHDPRVHNHEWAKELGLVSFAGYQLRPPHGETIGVLALFSKHPISSEENALLKSLSNLIVPVIQTAQAEELLEDLLHHNELILNSTDEGILGLDLEGKHTFVNPSAARMLGYEVEDLIGKRSHTIWHHSNADGSTYPEEDCPINATLKNGEVNLNKREEIFWRKDGTGFSVAYSSNPIMDEGKIIGAVVIFRDITEHKQLEDKINYLAYYDTLTGLPNRNLFLERIDRAIAKAHDTSNLVAVLITDINRFKSIFDLYGTVVGDSVLKEVGERLSTAVRKGDTVAHLGNDEFGIVFVGITGSDGIIMLENIMRDISYPLKFKEDEIALTFSTGVAIYPHDGKDPSALFKSAGLALAAAKKVGSKACQFYSQDIGVMASETMLMEKQLIKAMKNEEFILHYQPYWDINTKKMVGMEALIRWQSKDKGLIPPGKFIPLLEETGMIVEVGEWILKEAMRQVKKWQNNGYPVPVSVNMSLVQFRQKDLAEMVKRLMSGCGFYPSLLTLEITESAFMHDIEFTHSTLTTLKEIGCSVSIDDFGTGYSSLAYLKRFPVDNLKIDISFIREMVKDPDSASIVMAIINMAHTLNLKTIAEGIETEEQWNFLRLLRCDMGQGFYLSKPLPAEDFEKILERQ
jgi:diguanylate cyclase (GGDEF)-like protein/PAS domain S-box-containing protein